MKKLGYLRAIRMKCLDCAEDREEIKNCPMGSCALYPYRFGRGAVKGVSRLKAIRDKCLWCMNGQRREIKNCQSPGCALFSYRCRHTVLAWQSKGELSQAQGCP